MLPCQLLYCAAFNSLQHKKYHLSGFNIVLHYKMPLCIVTTQQIKFKLLIIRNKINMVFSLLNPARSSYFYDDLCLRPGEKSKLTFGTERPITSCLQAFKPPVNENAVTDKTFIMLHRFFASRLPSFTLSCFHLKWIKLICYSSKSGKVQATDQCSACCADSAALNCRSICNLAVLLRFALIRINPNRSTVAILTISLCSPAATSGWISQSEELWLTSTNTGCAVNAKA